MVFQRSWPSSWFGPFWIFDSKAVSSCLSRFWADGEPDLFRKSVMWVTAPLITAGSSDLGQIPDWNQRSTSVFSFLLWEICSCSTLRVCCVCLCCVCRQRAAVCNWGGERWRCQQLLADPGETGPSVSARVAHQVRSGHPHHAHEDGSEPPLASLQLPAVQQPGSVSLWCFYLFVFYISFSGLKVLKQHGAGAGVYLVLFIWYKQNQFKQSMKCLCSFRFWFKTVAITPLLVLLRFWCQVWSSLQLSGVFLWFWSDVCSPWSSRSFIRVSCPAGGQRLWRERPGRRPGRVDGAVWRRAVGARRGCAL